MITLILATVWSLGGYAQETAYKVLSFPPDNKDDVLVTSYLETKIYTIGSDSWTISNFNNNKWGDKWENIIKCGRKKETSVATISTKSSYNDAVSKIVVNLSALSSALKSLKLEVASDNDYSNIVETKSFAYSNLTKGDNTFNIESPAENCFYRLTFDCAKGSNGGAATVSSVKYYAANPKTIPTITFDDASVAGSTITINEGEESSFPTHVASCTTDGITGTFAYASDNACVTVDQNGKTAPGVGFGKAKITATFTPDDAYKDTYAESSAFYYIDYVEKEKIATTLSFNQSSVALTTLDLSSFTGQTPTLTSGDETLTGKSFTYSKSGDDIFSSFDEKTGVLALNGNAGTATVTATFAGDDTYASTSESYTVSVKSVVKDIATLKPQITSTSSSSTQSFSLKLTDAIVTYKNGKNAYVQDATGGLYTTGGSSLNVGDKINGIVDVKAYIKNGQRTVTSWTLSSDATVEKNVEFTPEVVTIAQLNENIDKYENMQVKVVGATVNAAMSSDQTTVSQDGEKITLFSKTSNITWELKADDYVDIVGFPCKYNKTNEICVWRKGDVTINESVIATTLSLAPATTEYTVEKGKESAFTAPTVTVTDANNETVADAKITYKSTNTDVATVAEDGTVSFVGFGTTNITASYAGDATHKAAADISYTIIYGKVKTTMAWSATEAKANIGEENFIAPTLSLTADGESILEGKTITYESDNENVATFVAGELMIGDEGTTIITAKFAGDETYAENSASYTLTVVDPNKIEVTFDFTNPTKYGYGTTSDSPQFGEGAGDIAGGNSISEGLVTLTNTTVSGSGTRFYSDGLRMYDGNVHTLSVPAGYRITSVAFDGASHYIIEDATANTSWTGSKRNVVIKYTGTNKKVSALTVGYKKVVLPSIALNEEDNDIVVLGNENKNVDVTLERTMQADGGWYTFCVPFDIDDISTTPLKDAEIRKYQSMTGSVMNFEATTSLKAAHAYLVKPTTTIANPVFNDVKVSLGDGENEGDGNYGFVGTLSATELATDGTNLFLGAGNKFYIPTQGKCKLKALRGYFVAPSSESGALMSIRIDDTTTSIAALNGDAATTNGKVYNLSGQYVGNDVKALPKGVYIVNGKKYIVK